MFLMCSGGSVKMLYVHTSRIFKIQKISESFHSIPFSLDGIMTNTLFRQSVHAERLASNLLRLGRVPLDVPKDGDCLFRLV